MSEQEKCPRCGLPMRYWFGGSTTGTYMKHEIGGKTCLETQLTAQTHARKVAERAFNSYVGTSRYYCWEISEKDSKIPDCPGCSVQCRWCAANYRYAIAEAELTNSCDNCKYSKISYYDGAPCLRHKKSGDEKPCEYWTPLEEAEIGEE
jgi:hypothetical protein